jgi:hypothetical protein
MNNTETARHAESIAANMDKRAEFARERSSHQLRDLRRRVAAGEPLSYADAYRLQRLEEEAQ